jgi:hypothetical protein
LVGTPDDEGGRKTIVGITFEFMELSEDKTIAIFQGDIQNRSNEDCVKERLREAIMKTEDGNLHMHNIAVPQHTVQVHREINDTPIPGLEMDWDKMRLSCDWKAMFTRFYAEEKHYNRLMDTFLEDNKVAADEMKEKMERGLMSMGDLFKQAMEMVGDTNKISYKRARRARVSRMMQENNWGSWNWDQDEENKKNEKKVLSELAKLRQWASTQDDNDFDGEKDDNGGDSSDGEDAEWEDADDDDESDGEVSMTEEEMEAMIDRMDEAMGGGAPPTIS